MKPVTDNPKPRGWRGTSADFDICGQQEGHVVIGVPDDGDDRSARRWDSVDARSDDYE